MTQFAGQRVNDRGARADSAPLGAVCRPAAGPLGILGGMGALASAEFLKTIYELNVGHREQEAPVCLLYSDPTFPDRTEAVLNGDEEAMAERLEQALKILHWQGCEKIVMACITLHHFLPWVQAELREKVLSLIDLIVDEVARSADRHLLLSTNGTRRAGILSRHARWSLVEDRVVLPDEEDQADVHRLIYQLKANRFAAVRRAFLDSLLEKYGAGSFIAGCTEIHLLNKYLNAPDGSGRKVSMVDPLMTLARELKKHVVDA